MVLLLKIVIEFISRICLKKMKICIYGAGAIGAYLGAMLKLSGNDVTLIARGPHLEAMKKSGLTLISDDEEKVVGLRCTDNPEDAGRQDYVFITLKAHSVLPIVDRMLPLLDKNTAIVTAQNGILWWYFYKLQGAWENQHIECADPGRKIWDTIGPERVIGCVVYPSCEIVEPGVVKHINGKRFMVGEPDGSKSQRVTALSKLLMLAGLKAPVRTNIRDDIWLKLWGNVSFNPVSVLTLGTLEQMCRNEGTRKVIRDIMLEAQAVAKKLRVEFPVDVDTRIQWGEDVGNHKTSMLQDLEKGRPMEVDSLVSTVSEIGKLVDVDTSTLDTVLRLVRLRAELT